MFGKTTWTLMIAAACLSAVAKPARAQSPQPQPFTLNLGFTSFLDGAPPGGPGFYFMDYLQNIHADEFHDKNGNRVPFPDPELDVWINLFQFIYVADYELWPGAHPELDVILPIANTNTSYGAPGPFPNDNGFGFSDMLVGPGIQFDPIMGADGPIFVQRIEAQFNIPTGKFSDTRAINPGSGFGSFNPYWAGTLFLTKKAEISFRAHYLWSFRNDEPNLATGANTATAGQAFHINFASSYEIIEKRLRAGVNGYFLQQTTRAKFNSFSVPGSAERVLAIGPGLLYSFSPNSHFFCNLYFETQAKNRPEGTRLNFRYVHKF